MRQLRVCHGIRGGVVLTLGHAYRGNARVHVYLYVYLYVYIYQSFYLAPYPGRIIDSLPSAAGKPLTMRYLIVTRVRVA